LKLSGDGHGTHFIITPTEEILIDDISTSDSNKTTEQSSRLEKALLGFTNTMYSDSNPPIIARFRDYLEDCSVVLLLSLVEISSINIS
ncbi:hypothetical protein, partial [Salmonella enterica]|uniref:hypothetical protein n=1 Tax=Salmonella enterica TaxID=28901 RepID=UPI00111C7D6A